MASIRTRIVAWWRRMCAEGEIPAWDDRDEGGPENLIGGY